MGINTVMIRPSSEHVVDTPYHMFRSVQNKDRITLVCIVISRMGDSCNYKAGMRQRQRGVEMAECRPTGTVGKYN